MGIEKDAFRRNGRARCALMCIHGLLTRCQTQVKDRNTWNYLLTVAVRCEARRDNQPSPPRLGAISISSWRSLVTSISTLLWKRNGDGCGASPAAWTTSVIAVADSTS